MPFGAALLYILSGLIFMVNYIRKKFQKNLCSFGFTSPLGERESMKAKIEKAASIEDGSHEGKIIKIEYKEKPYRYVDITIKESIKEIELRASYPFKITENTALGQILQNFGAALVIGEDIEIEDYLKIGSSVSFITMTEQTERGKFARIIPTSLKKSK